jgi:hypothetical protein
MKSQPVGTSPWLADGQALANLAAPLSAGGPQLAMDCGPSPSRPNRMAAIAALGGKAWIAKAWTGRRTLTAKRAF